MCLEKIKSLKDQAEDIVYSRIWVKSLSGGLRSRHYIFYKSIKSQPPERQLFYSPR